MKFCSSMTAGTLEMRLLRPAEINDRFVILVINGVAQVIGEDSFVLGSDYPHGDPSRQEDIVAEFRERKDLSSRMVEKMLSDNPRRLYGL